jgi:hypothetical protein
MKKIVKMVVIAQKKQRHVSFVDQKLAPSSRENSTPPIGAPKAAAMPAAVPHAAKSGGDGSDGGNNGDGDGGGGGGDVLEEVTVMVVVAMTTASPRFSLSFLKSCVWEKLVSTPSTEVFT